MTVRVANVTTKNILSCRVEYLTIFKLLTPEVCGFFIVVIYNFQIMFYYFVIINPETWRSSGNCYE